jgi:hypothetical protein
MPNHRPAHCHMYKGLLFVRLLPFRRWVGVAVRTRGGEAPLGHPYVDEIWVYSGASRWSLRLVLPPK